MVTTAKIRKHTAYGIMAAVSALAGLAALGLSGAATFVLPQEAEAGRLAGQAYATSDAAAAAGGAVRFGALPGSGGGGTDNCDAAARPPSGVNQTMALAFCDDFTGAAVDTAKWSFQSSAESDWSGNPLGTGNPANQQLEFDQPANCTQSNGILHMTAKRETVRSQSGHTYGWTSCMINSSPSYAFRYGYLEERARLPAPKGFWPALWTWGADGVTCGGNCETDVFEYYSDNKTKLYLTQHNTGGGSCDYDMPFDPTAAMHTYGADIQPTGTTWYVDGVKACHVATTAGGNSNILVDNFVYSQIPPDSGTVSADTLIDYVRAWR